ncbi:variant surface glycoprotein (VSG) pseudogene,putative [Trypanosoma brucei gambiense DAL972]|uniref:variant surface glycoprotein (VSG) pseudogene,putative n=1 Tax=Trypanosoma brucei gambiense (strain MHOM/CI/86/DAL972) TaxID=679716 RepID=UPI0001B9E045|nr:variant surface glycoprotein (VSG) pseudogene,putative [Trypanosoma brucei gambiense DAL972]CBH12875.1 variant surface glycoprotein (VSG) pseudogene,putative [Trypanosoma brucei gambiense DAL972]|eukprot:XP_011775154.1 variant surface glycoprotein (VSG) pseudogene,putative [Trypanosoma brucei gambiense DAL972]
MNGQANALVVTLFLATNQVSPEITADDNALEFRALSQFVNMATVGIKTALAPQIDKAAAAYIGALNLTLADNTIAAAVDEAKPWEQLGKPQQQALNGSSDYYEYWQPSKKQITEHKSTIESWIPKTITPQLRAKVEELASKAKAIYEQRAPSYTITEPVDQLINGVLYGKAQPITTNPSTGGSAEAEKLKTECANYGAATPLTHESLAAAWAGLRTLIKPDKVTTTKTAKHILGKVGSTGGSYAGCSGRVNINGGQCVQYKDEHFKNSKITIPWNVNLENAVKRNAEEVKHGLLITQENAELKQMNETITAQLAGFIKPRKLQNHRQKKSDACAEHKTNSICTKNNCKWNGTTEDRGEYKVDETKVKEQTNAGIGDGEQTSKCTGQDTKEKCEAVQGTAPPGKKSVCVWIKGKCQDSSFLLNKQFAIMVSAAFVAFLYKELFISSVKFMKMFLDIFKKFTKT